MSDVPPPALPSVWAGGHRLRDCLTALTFSGGVCLLFLGCGLALDYRLLHVSNWLIGLSFVAAAYSFLLAYRASRLSGLRLRSAWQNFILLSVLSIAGVAVIGITLDHHRRFWRQVLPSLARELRG